MYKNVKFTFCTGGKTICGSAKYKSTEILKIYK